MWSDAAARIPDVRASQSGTRTARSHTSSSIPAPRRASRAGSPKKPGTVATTSSVTSPRCQARVALTVAQPSANSQNTTLARWISSPGASSTTP